MRTAPTANDHCAMRSAGFSPGKPAYHVELEATPPGMLGGTALLKELIVRGLASDRFAAPASLMGMFLHGAYLHPDPVDRLWCGWRSGSPTLYIAGVGHRPH